MWGCERQGVEVKIFTIQIECFYGSLVRYTILGYVRVKSRVHGVSCYSRSCAANFSVSARGRRDVGRRTGVSVGGPENCRGRSVGRSARRGLEFNEHLSVRGDLAQRSLWQV